ncbi:MAG TPA: hypothetical protein VK187_06615 [Geobacteraceae bacterium]|nr:hypothetical protein [Geobacteraceae bacterium]
MHDAWKKAARVSELLAVRLLSWQMAVCNELSVQGALGRPFSGPRKHGFRYGEESSWAIGREM